MAAVGSAAPLAFGLRVQLSIMMLLQYAIWGAWFVSFFTFVQDGLGYSASDAGWIFGTMALGTIFTPMLFGQIADRYLSSEKLMAQLHLVGAGLLWLMSVVDTKADSFLTAPIFWISLLYAFVYSPTLALSNSIAFRHIPDGERDFPGIRVMGTIGWIAVGYAVGMGVSKFLDNPSDYGKTGLPLQFASVLSLITAGYCMLLPNTPPTGQKQDSFPFLAALKLFQNPSFAVFFLVSTVLAVAMSFYYGLTFGFLKDIGVEDPQSVMTIGQWSELILLPFLPIFLARMGMKGVLVCGMAAWGVRYGIFALGEPKMLIIVSLALHGICFDFFFAAAFIHMDNEAPKDIRASAQSLFTMLTYGIGMFAGNVLSGILKGAYTKDGKTAWQEFWVIPSLGVLVCLLLFVLLFRGPINRRQSAEDTDTPAATGIVYGVDG